MSLRNRLAEYVRACFTGLWIESHEHEDALREIAQLCADESWRLVTWNIESGLTAGGHSDAGEASAADPLAAIRSLQSADGGTATVLVLANFHRFLNSAEIVQALAGQLVAGKQSRGIVVVLAPVAVTASESVDRLREWSDGRCLSAIRSGLYRCGTSRRTRRGNSDRFRHVDDCEQQLWYYRQWNLERHSRSGGSHD